MADISREIDKIAELIEAKTGQAIEEIARSLTELTQDMTSEEALTALSGINLKYAMESKLPAVFAAFDAGIVLTLRNTYSTVVLPEEALRILLETAKKKLRTELTDILTDNMMQNIINGIATKSPIEDVLKSIGDVTPDLKTLVNTTYSQFSNTLTNMMLEKLPDNTMMVYIGPHDDITRQDCKDKINFSPATKKKVLGKYGNFNNELWNCRHKWEERGRDTEAQGFSPEEFTD